jgi:hypothetical protein
MRIVVHIFVFYVITALPFVHSTTSQNIARSLSLVGPLTSVALEWCPVVLIFIYAAFAFATRKSSAPSVWIGGAAGGIILALVGAFYLDWLVECCSRKIAISSFVAAKDMFLPAGEIRRFEQTFGTPTAQYSVSREGRWLVVRRDKYTPAMVAFLSDEAQRKAETGDATIRSQPARPGTNQSPTAAGPGR